MLGALWLIELVHQYMLGALWQIIGAGYVLRLVVRKFSIAHEFNLVHNYSVARKFNSIRSAHVIHLKIIDNIMAVVIYGTVLKVAFA